MSIAFMISSLIFIPKTLSLLAIGGLTLSGLMEFRQGHIGRIGIAANAFLLWQIFYGSWLLIPEWFQWYLNVGTIFALVAVPAYLVKFRLPKEFYQLGFILYGSISVIVSVILIILFGIPII